MSDQLRIAAVLRKLDNASLEKLITLRMINASHFRDFFDLADALITSKSISAALSALSANQINALKTLTDATGKADGAFLAQLMLVEKTEKGYEPFESVSQVFAELLKTQTKPTLSSVSSANDLLDIESVDRDASLAIFDVIQALTELIFELEQRFIREVGKRQVGLPDVKRLANHLSKSNEYAKQIFELAALSDIAIVENGRWQLGENTNNWITWSDEQRWQLLADTWLQMLGEAATAELLAIQSGENFEEKLSEVFPYADATVGNRIKKVAELAALIGLVASGQATSWLAGLSDGKAEKVAAKAVAGLPKPDERIIVQADLTLIAPSPLPTDLEIQLRRFVDTEKIGMASSYRLSHLSVSHGLETGLTILEIRGMLERLAAKPLPQPVDYLLKEAETRFARLTVRPIRSGAHSVIESSDPILLAEIHNDHRMKPFALHFDEHGKLHSRLERELVYFALREANFVAVMVDEDGIVESPQKHKGGQAVSSTANLIAADIERMRSNDSQGSDDPQEDFLLRQIQLAIKNKATVAIKLKTADGQELEYLVEPVGVANGRIRAKDRKADIERTLPMSSVVSIEIQ